MALKPTSDGKRVAGSFRWRQRWHALTGSGIFDGLSVGPLLTIICAYDDDGSFSESPPMAPAARSVIEVPTWIQWRLAGFMFRFAGSAGSCGRYWTIRDVRTSRDLTIFCSAVRMVTGVAVEDTRDGCVQNLLQNAGRYYIQESTRDGYVWYPSVLVHNPSCRCDESDHLNSSRSGEIEPLSAAETIALSQRIESLIKWGSDSKTRR